MSVVIGRVQKTRGYQFADAIEIQCAFGGGTVSKTDAYSLALGAVQPAEEVLGLDAPDLDDDGLPDDLDGVEVNERLQGFTDECFRQLEYRSGEFGGSYPFLIQDERLTIREQLSSVHKVYLVLLAASRLRSFSFDDPSKRGFKQKVADQFEVICRDSLAKLMGLRAEVVMFGPNSSDRQLRFGSNLRDAFPRLAEFMGMDLTAKWEQKLAPQGDAGIDLIGVQPLDSAGGNWSVFVGQCAAHEEPDSWRKKRSEADFHYQSRFAVLARPQPVLFIPSCFRQPDGHWVDKGDVTAVIAMDRVRIMRVLDPADPCVASSVEFMETMFGIS